MKKYKCPICGNVIDDTNKNLFCKKCNTPLDRELVFKTNPTKVKKFKIINYAINHEFETIIDLNYDDNELIFNYFMMYSKKMENLEYDEDSFFSKEYKYTNEEIDRVILHMLEHFQNFEYKNIKAFILKYGNGNEKYDTMLRNIMIKMDERIKEKDLREELFPKTTLPYKEKLYNSKLEDGKTTIFVGLLLLLLFPAIVFIFFKDEMRYNMFNVALIFPCIFLSSGINKVSLKKPNFLVQILIFIVLYYFLTLLYGFSYMEYTGNILFNHLKGIALTPYEIVKALIEA